MLPPDERMNAPSTIHPDALRYAERGVSRNVIQKILVIVDPAAQTHLCIEKAARLAMSFGSTIELFACDVVPEVPDNVAGSTTTAQFRGLMREERVAALETLAAPLRSRGVSITTTSHWCPQLDVGIVEHAIRSGADLVMKDVSASAEIDWSLIRQVPMPLLLVRAGEWQHPTRIAVSVDPCHLADRPVALDEAIVAMGSCLGRALAGEIQILHVLQSPPHLPGEPITAEARDHACGHQRAAVERLAVRMNVGREAVTYIENTVAEGIVELVDLSQPNILVIGTAGRPRSPEPSTSGWVMAHVSCDVLIMKPSGFVSPVLITDN
jgi:universal stress protein E